MSSTANKFALALQPMNEANVCAVSSDGCYGAWRFIELLVRIECNFICTFSVVVAIDAVVDRTLSSHAKCTFNRNVLHTSHPKPISTYLQTVYTEFGTPIQTWSGAFTSKKKNNTKYFYFVCSFARRERQGEGERERGRPKNEQNISIKLIAAVFFILFAVCCDVRSRFSTRCTFSLLGFVTISTH